MSTRKNTLLLKRSSIAGAIPVAGQLQLGEIALNTSDVKLYASGTTPNSILQIGWDRVSRTGDTMTGTLFGTSLSGGTISATTFYGDGSHLSGIGSGSSFDTKVTGGTFSNNILTLTNNTGGTVSTVINNFSGLTVNGTISATTISGTSFFGDGSNLTLGKVSFIQTANGNVSGTTNEVTLLSAGTGSLVIPAAKFTVGKAFRVSAYGVLSTDTSNPTTTTYRLKFGNTTIAATAGIFQGATITNRVWEISSIITIRSIGTGGTIMTTGMYQDNNSNGNTIDNGTTPVVYNTTTGATINFTMQLTQTAVANKVTCLNFILGEIF
jgi:hypothetical protein